MLYLGPPASITHEGLSPDRCRDPGYLKMRTDRLMLVGLANRVERFKSFCAAHAGK